jgi:hypothetical protein
MKHDWIAFAQVTAAQAIPLRHGRLVAGVKFQIRCYACDRRFCLRAFKEDCVAQIERALTKSKRLSLWP